MQAVCPGILKIENFREPYLYPLWVPENAAPQGGVAISLCAPPYHSVSQEEGYQQRNDRRSRPALISIGKMRSPASACGRYAYAGDLSCGSVIIVSVTELPSAVNDVHSPYVCLAVCFLIYFVIICCTFRVSKTPKPLCRRC